MSFTPLPDEKLRVALNEVEKPGRYMGNEVNMVRKDPASVRLKVALVFPDVYEMGESHVGLKILYKILNDRPDILAERVYAPWVDLEKSLERHGLPLFSLESKTPLHQFDLIGITLPYELVYTNIVTILKSGGVPLWQKDRGAGHPLVIAGGSCAFNPEPIADFLDAVVVGDGEDVILQMVDRMIAAQDSARSRNEILKDMTSIEGVYVPSFFTMHYREDGAIREIEAKFPEYPGVRKATVTDLDGAAYPTAPIVPNIEVIHDRIGVEVQRGCVRMCRFCQAGYIYRPERQRSPDTVKRIIADSLKNTGQEDVSLLSLSVGDYEPLNPLLNELFNTYEKQKVSISLPATRTETLTPEIIRQIKRVRKTGFTIAPEAGTPRMRRLINKGNEREDLMKTVENVFSEGWRMIKFYYMCGLPLELESDLLGIVEEAQQARDIGRKYTHHPELNVSVSSFVPKPFTPFQWEPQPSIAQIEDKHRLLKSGLGRIPGVKFKWHNVKMSYLEGVFSRGDRRLSAAVARAHELGCRFDEWDEQLNFDAWQQAFRETGIDPDFYVSRRRPKEETLPWDHLFIQMKKDFLWDELSAAHDLAFVDDCSFGKCPDCGVCDFRKVKNVNYDYNNQDGNVRAYSTRRRILKDVPAQHLVPPEAEKEKFKNPESVIRIRAQFCKLGDAAYLSHLDLMTLLKRALKRAEIPVGFSQGFHPMMLLSLSPALPVGVESEAEFLDIELTRELAPQEFVDRLNPVLPTGITLQGARLVQKNIPSLNATLKEQIYQIRLQDGVDVQTGTLDERVKVLEDSSEVRIERRRAKQTKSVDIRPMIAKLEVVAPNELKLTTKFGQTSGTVKPAEVLEALFPRTQGARAFSRVRKVEARFE